ncbi:hypothetical protein GPJ56_005744 [Histomonas meleagridis]|uniref:uncharacterized protein n=1 Tax=Histomonas meleagridis TaxID=135588 RepID=UPI0035593921|nr:hypothetical protein GPJ56_005744 [Histomonas meleagridis]KAH0803320.1 hypothetical protein GO595_003664 [Histomonas meleagridis]
MNEYSESSSEEIEKPKTKPKPKAKPPKSSIALFLHPDSQKSTQIIDECLFSEEIKEENEPPSMTIEENNQMYNEEEKEIESPPIISIEMNEKSTEFIEKEKTQQDNIQEEEEKDNFLESHINQVLDKINSGINTLTRQRLEMVDHFGQKLNSIVDSLHEDIRTTLRDREHGSIKQLEISKQQFQANLQKFKRQESQMQQTLIGFENETRQMSEKIVNIQKTIRNELQNHRINLEEELKRLRKMIRTQADKSIEDDVEEYVYQKPKTRNVKRIPLII